MRKKGPEDSPIVRMPRLATIPCQTHFQEYHRNLEYIWFVTNLATRADWISLIAKRALESQGPLPKEEILSHVFKNGHMTGVLRKKFARILLETTMCRAVDNLLVYISELTRLIFLQRPETLRSNEKISHEEALSQTSMEDLVAYITDKKVNELSYLGLNALSDHFQNRLGLEMFINNTQKMKAIYAVELRNVIVHNRSLINDLFRRRTGLKDLEVGNLADLNFDIVKETMNDIANLVANLDQTAAKKFRIRRQRTRSPA